MTTEVQKEKLSPDVSATNPVTPADTALLRCLVRQTSTPKHRILSAGKHSRRLTPNTPLTPSSSQTVYRLARQAFSRNAEQGQLVGREEERGRLNEFLARCTTSTPGGLYLRQWAPGNREECNGHGSHRPPRVGNVFGPKSIHQLHESSVGEGTL